MAEPEGTGDQDIRSNITSASALEEPSDLSNARGLPSATEQGTVEAPTTKAALEPVVLAALRRLSTSILQSEDYILSGGDYFHGFYHKGLEEVLGANFVAAKRIFTASELVDLAKPIISSRMKAQRKFQQQLSQRHVDSLGREWPVNTFVPTSAADRKYWKWLATGDVAARLPHEADHASYFSKELANCVRPLLTKRNLIESAYEIDCSSEDGMCGAVLIENISLRWMCELGDHFSLDPGFFLEHLQAPPMSPEEKARSSIGIRLGGAGIVRNRSETHIAFDDPLQARNMELGNADLWTTLLNVRGSFFVVLCTDTKEPLIELPSTDDAASAMLVLSANGGRPGLCDRVTLLPTLKEFFCDAWNAQRLAKLLGHSPTLLLSRYLVRWLFAVAICDETLRVQALGTQALDYELIALPTAEALDRIKSYRGSVARVRNSIAKLFTSANIWTRGPYQALRVQEDNHTIPTEAGADASTGLTISPRQFASQSAQSEYEWLDKRAADLMPLLNEQLQLVIAQLSVEQSQKAAEQTAASHRLAELTVRDSAISIKNGERSTLLTLLAAIYLPLTLATGIFGMNIRDINSETVQFWWPIIIAAVLMIPSGVIVGYIFWRSRKDSREAKDQHYKGDKLA